MNAKIKKTLIFEVCILIVWFVAAYYLRKMYVGRWTIDEIRYYYQDMVQSSTIKYSDGTTETLKIPFGFYMMLFKAFVFNYPHVMYFLYAFTRLSMYMIWKR